MFCFVCLPSSLSESSKSTSVITTDFKHLSLPSEPLSSEPLSTTMCVCFAVFLCCSVTLLSGCDAVDPASPASTPFRVFLTFFGFVICIILLAFHLTLLIAVLGFADDLLDDELELFDGVLLFFFCQGGMG